MLVKVDVVIWVILFGVLKVYKKVEVGEFVFGELVKFELRNLVNFVMFLNIYGDFGRFDDVVRLKVVMRDMGFKKEVGVSWIEIDDGLVKFYFFGEKYCRIEEL